MNVVNIKNCKYDVYIGRGTRYGNPFIIGKDGNREQCITKFKNYLLTNSELLSHLYELDGKTLGCHCKPKACHGDVLKDIRELQKLEEMYG